MFCAENIATNIVSENFLAVSVNNKCAIFITFSHLCRIRGMNVILLQNIYLSLIKITFRGTCSLVK